MGRLVMSEIASVADQPKPGTGPSEIVALRRPFAPCGKLTPLPNRPR